VEPIKKRYDFVLVFDVKNGNPNGDPDAGNAPRVDPETGFGLVSDVCLKRKIRNYICLAKRDPKSGQPMQGYDIYVKEKGVLNQQHQRAYTALGVTTDDAAKKSQDKARAWMCQTFFDIRMFGAVMSTGKNEPRKNCGQVRGPVQITFARSIEPIVSLEQSITRVALTTEEKAQKQIEERGSQSSEMGRKEIVPYALYEAHGFVSPFLAADTVFTEADLDLLWQALASMFEQDRSAARGEMASRKLVVFEHESPLGNAPAHALFERVQVKQKDTAKPARNFSDYSVTLNRDSLPPGIKMREIV
jgi:CRISPR-associated protein Csd2